MAQKRMFDKSITNNDMFLEMPLTTQALYFHLSMNADDDGFVDNWKSIMRMLGSKDDDMKLLIAKYYVIPFETGVIVIRHWRVNNYLRSDRYNQTKYLKLKEQLGFGENGEYVLQNKGGIPLVDTDKIRLDKNRLDNIKEKDIEKEKRFVKPTIEEIKKYCDERNNGVNPEKFYNFYESKGWYVGKNKMKDWKASVRTWERNTSNDLKTPEWFDNEQNIKPLSIEEQEEMNNLLEEFK